MKILHFVSTVFLISLTCLCSTLGPPNTPSASAAHLPVKRTTANGCFQSSRMEWGYIDRSGVVVIKPQFDSADQFSEGLAFVRYPNREKPMKSGEISPEIIIGAGYIDETGKIVVELESPLYLVGTIPNGDTSTRQVTAFGSQLIDRFEAN